MGSHRREGNVERKRWISSSEASYFPSVLLLLLVLSFLLAQREGRERLKGGGTAGEETHSSCYGERERGRKTERGGNLPQ